MENLETTSTESTAAATIDLNAERKAIAEAKAALQERERIIVEEELRLAVATHESLLAECGTAQETFDDLDRKVEAAHHVALQALTRRNGAAMAIDTHRRNPPTRRFDGGRPLSQSIMQEWRDQLPPLLAEKETADAAHTKAFAELQQLQGARRMAGTTLENASWRASDAATVMAGLRAKLAKMQPQTFVAPRPPQDIVAPDYATGTLTVDGIRPF